MRHDVITALDKYKQVIGLRDEFLLNRSKTLHNQCMSHKNVMDFERGNRKLFGYDSFSIDTIERRFSKAYNEMVGVNREREHQMKKKTAIDKFLPEMLSPTKSPAKNGLMSVQNNESCLQRNNKPRKLQYSPNPDPIKMKKEE